MSEATSQEKAPSGESPVGVVPGLSDSSEAVTQMVPSSGPVMAGPLTQRRDRDPLPSRASLTSLTTEVFWVTGPPMTQTHCTPAAFPGVVDSRDDIPADVCHALGWTNEK